MGFLFDEKYAREFQLFGWLHILILALAAGSLVGLYYLRERLKNPTAGAVFRYSVATLLLVGETVYQVWFASLHGAHWAEIAPLGLCGMMVWITVIALFFNLTNVIRVVLPWAFLGPLLSFIVVNMGTVSYTFPHYRFFHYFGIHWLFLIGNLYYLFTEKFRYGYRDLLRSTAWLAGTSLVVLAINFATDQNFMFLREWPDEMDFFNQFLPFPLNTLVLILGAFLVFNLFYLIFVVKRFDKQPAAAAISEVPEPVA